MTRRSVLLEVVVQTLVLLAGFAAAAAAVLWAAQPLWQGRRPPAVPAPRRWVPYRIPGFPAVMWRPENWRLRCGRTAVRTDVVLEATPVAVVWLSFWAPDAGPATPADTLEQFLSAAGTRPGFWAEPAEGITIAGVAAEGRRASWWQPAGLRLIPWHCELWAARTDAWTAAAAASCDHYNWPRFAPVARAAVASITALPSTDR